MTADIDNLRNRCAAARKSRDYNARNFVDVPVHIAERLLDEIEAARRVVEAARGVSDPGLDRLRCPLSAYDRAIGAGGEG